MNIELEITLRCNIACPGCSRHCSYLDYSDSDMTLEQIDKFVAEVKNHGDVDLISVMGGEPTIHPDFEIIMLKIYSELFQKGVIKRLQIVTNGVIPVSEVIKQLPLSVITVLWERDKLQNFRCQLVAPIDTGQEMKDWRDCEVLRCCGTAVNTYGVSPCGAGGAIARLFGLKKYIVFHLPKSASDFGDLWDMCKYCQVLAKPYMFYKDYGYIQSRSFKEAFNGAEERIRKLHRY